MSEQLYVLISNRPYEGGWTKYREATPEQIDEAAGVTELRKRLGQYQTLIDTQQGVIVEQRKTIAELRAQLNSESDIQALQRDEIAKLKAQLAQRDEDAEAYCVLKYLGDDYKVTNDGLQGGWEVIQYYGSFQHHHWESEELRDALCAAGLLPVEDAADETK